MKDVLGPVFRAPGMSLFAMLASMLLLCWPAFTNGGAFFFPDTTTYLREADAAVIELTGWESEWSDKFRAYDGITQQKSPESGTSPQVSSDIIHPVLLGRSIYYGLAIFPFISLFGSIGGALLQAALAVIVIYLVLIAFGVQRSRLPVFLLVTTLLLASLTSLPFFVSLLMPDVFAGFAIALAVSSLIGWDRLSKWEKIVLTLLLLFTALTHSSHVLLLLALFGTALLFQLCTRVNVKTGLAVILLAAVCGIMGERLFIFAVTERLDSAPIRPPFLTARLIDDGPGLDLLLKRCPAIGFEACHFLGRMPRDSDSFLWSPDRTNGVFSAENFAVQKSLSNQDFEFALATLLHDPVSVIRSSANNVTRQIFLTDINIFNAPLEAARDGGIAINLPPSYANEVRMSLYAARSMPVRLLEWANVLTAIAAAIFMAATIVRQVRGGGMRTRRAIAASLFLVAVIANATATGALSKPHDRYNVRVIWVLQLAALALLAAGRVRNFRELDNAET